MVMAGQQDNIGEKLTVILYDYINRHTGTPQQRQKHTEDHEPGRTCFERLNHTSTEYTIQFVETDSSAKVGP